MKTASGRLLVALLAFIPPAEAKGAKVMKNQDVINLVQANVSADVILATIDHSKNGLDASPETLFVLKNKGVPDNIV